MCLFPTLEAAEDFDKKYQNYRVLYKNKKEIFGDQLILDEKDEVIGEEDNLLLNASTLSIDEAVPLLRSYGAIVFPAHIDRDENGIIAALGWIPDEPHFSIVEFRDNSNIEAYTQMYNLEEKIIVTDSDAHYLWDISEAENSFVLEDEPYSSALVREKLFELLAEK